MLAWHTRSPGFNPKHYIIQAQWYTSVIPALQEVETRDQKVILGYTEFEVNLGYIRPYLRKNLGAGERSKKIFLLKISRSTTSAVNQILRMGSISCTKKRKRHREYLYIVTM